MCNFQFEKSSPDVVSKPQSLKYPSKIAAVRRLFAMDTAGVLFYAAFLLLSGFVLCFWVTGSCSFDNAWKFVGMQLEIFGLCMLREKIKIRGSVSGISGNTFLIQSLVYLSRVAWSCKESQSLEVIVELGPLLLVLDVLKSIYVTHRSTYNEELDVLKAWYIVPGCMMVALVVHPYWLDGSALYNYCVGSVTYVDAVTLMPQVIMMAKSDGKVEVPIANFVAATAIARCGDVFHTLFLLKIALDMSNFECLRFWLNGELDEMGNAQVYSWILCVMVHIVQLILVVDFLYYFYKARAWASKVTEEITLYHVDHV